jgi:lysophospholipase L1-like esterase
MTGALGLITARRVAVLAAKVVVGVFAGLGALVYLHLAWARFGPQYRPFDDLETHMGSDWAWMAKYRRDDGAIRASGERPDIVFIGDSITEFWKTWAPGFFRHGYVDRGIAGESSPQILVRFRQDAIDLHPRVVHILMGTNDVGGRTGPMSPQETEENFETLTELARANHITVILGTTPPTRHTLGKNINPSPRIRALDDWIRAYAAHNHIFLIDYASVLDDGRGGLAPALSTDGIHPNAKGYAVMRAMAEPIIRAALGANSPPAAKADARAP